MSIKDPHPLYTQAEPDWRLMTDSYQGERSIKEAGQQYLPATSGMHADGMQPDQPGWLAYRAYKMRAVYHDYVSDAVEALVGMMHHKEPVIELPTGLEAMRTNAGPNGEGLTDLLRKINEQQLVTGRTGLMLDLPQSVPSGVDPMPYLALYRAQDIINWDQGTRVELGKPELNLVVLDESGYQRKQDFSWEWAESYRVLALGEMQQNEPAGSYKQGVFGSSNFNEQSMFEPSLRGATLDRIPFVFVNTKDIATSPDDSPLLGLARLCLAIYRGEADYRQNLFMQSQDTLVVIGERDEDKTHRIGAGASINLPLNGDAKFIGVSSQGLSEQRSALENDKRDAAQKAGNAVDTRSRQKESGEALRVRISAQTATLNQIARTSASALEKLLKDAAVWKGLNPDEVSVSPNVDFVDEEFTPQNLGELWAAKVAGAPISRESIHFIMRDKGLTEMSYEDELNKIDEERDDGFDLPGNVGSSNPNLPDEDDQ